MLSTNPATAAALLVWFFLDLQPKRKLSVAGAIKGMICGLVATTPAAGHVNGFGAVAVGLLGAGIPWFTLNRLSNVWPFKRSDHTLGAVHTHFTRGRWEGSWWD